MNKHLYRIIFNQRRGQLMVVGETAAAQGKQAAGTGGTAGATDGQVGSAMTAALRPVALAVFGVLGMVLFVSGPAMGQIVADPRAPGSQRPTIVQSANGTTQVNIQTPSAAGVSRNTYSQFDVQAGGAILNNSRGAVQTQTGGWVQANPWLAGGSARVILNEVNSANPSQLRGYVEVAGQRAEVVIANPAGMAIDGGGFINASRVVLTTGTPILNGGSLDGYSVQRGIVTIDGRGLDTSLTDYTAILARAVQINGGLWARELNVVTGSNRLDAGHGVAAAEAGEGAAPTYALDVAQLGGMYAGKITLIGTEAGLGVRNAGTLAASAGNLVLQSNGWLSNSGTVYAGGDSQVGVQGSIANTGLIGAQGNLDVTAGARIDTAAGAVIAAGLNTDNTLRSAGNLNLAAGDTVAVHGAVAAGGDSRLTAANLELAGAQLSGANLALAATAGDLDLAGAQVDARAGLRLDAAQAVRNARGQLTAQALTVNAQSLSNADGRIVQLGAADLAIDLSGALDNTRGVIATNSDALTLHAASLSNVDGTIEHAGTGRLDLAAGALDLQRGAISTNGALALTGAIVDHRGARTVAGQLMVEAGTLDNRGGSLAQLGQGQATVQAGALLDNRGGAIDTNGAATLGATVVRNEQGRLAAGQALALDTGTLANQNGTLAAGATLQVNAGAIDNTRGQIQSVAGDVQMSVSSLDNTGGSVAAGRDVGVTAQDVANSGSIYAAGNLALLARGGFDNTGVAAARGDARIDAGRIASAAGSLLGAGVNADGTLSDRGQLHVSATGAIAAHGQNLAGGDAILRANSVDVAASQTAGANIVLDAQAGNVVTDGAQVTTPGTLTLSAAGPSQTLSNVGGTLNAGQLALTTGRLDNRSGAIIQTGSGDTLLRASTLDNTSGRLAVNSANLTIEAGALGNQGGSVEHAGTGTLAIRAGQMSGQQGRVTGNGVLDLQAGAADLRHAVTTGQQVLLHAATLDHRAGQLQQTGTGQMRVDVDGLLDNTQGAIAGNGTLALHAAALSNQQGSVTAASGEIAVNGSLDNRDGVLAAAQALHVDSNALDNTRGVLQAGASLTLDAASLLNQQGTASAGSDLVARISGDVTNSGLLYAARDQQWTVRGRVDNAGSLAAGRNVGLTAASIASSGMLGAGIAQDGSLGTSGALDMHAAGLLQASGQNLAAGMAVFNGAEVDLRGSHTGAADVSITARTGDVRTDQAQVSASGLLSITASAANGTDSQALSNRGGQLSAGQLQVAAGRLDNVQGRIVSSGSAAVTTGNVANTDGLLSAAGDLVLRGADVDNTRGQLQAVAGSATLDVGALNNTAGAIFAGGDLRASAARVDNTGSVYAQGDLSLHASGVVQNTGSLYTAGDLALDAGDAVRNTGMLAAQGAARIEALALDSSSGSLLGAGMQADGRLTATGDLTITTGQSLAAHGQTLAAGAAALTGASVDLGGSWTSAGSLALTATHGDIGIDQAHVSTAGALDIITPGALHNTGGLLYAGRDARIAVGGMLTITGSLAAAGSNTITAGTVTSSGLLGAGMNPDGTLATSGDLRIVAAGALQASGQTLAAGGAWLDGAQIDLARGQVGADQLDFTARSGDVLTNGAVVSARNVLAITANARNGQQLVNTSGRLEAGQLQLNVGNFVNTQGSVVQAGAGDTVITTGLLDNTGGKIEGNGDALVRAQLVLNSTGRLSAGGDVTLVAGGFDNGTGNLSAGRHLALTADTVGNAGSVYAAGNLALSASGAVTNTGVLAAQGDATLQAQHFNSGAASLVGAGILADGSLGAAGNLTVDTKDVLQAGGQTLAAGAMALTGAAVDVSGGQVGADRIALTARSGDVATGKALVSARTLLAITANAGNGQRLVNAGGQLQAGQLQLTVANLDNRQGEIVQTGIGDTTIATGALDNTAGRIAVNSANLALTASTLTNTDGKLEHAGSGAFTVAAGQLDGQRGRITANNALAIHAGAIDHRDASTVAAQVNIAAASLDNQGGSIGQTGSGRMTVGVTGVLDNTGGKIEGNGGALVTADQLRNNGGRIVAAHDTVARVQDLSNVDGTMSGGHALDIHGATIDNTLGQLQAVTGHATLTIDRLDNAAGSVYAGQDLAISAAMLANSGSLYAAGDQQLTVAGAVTNTGMIAAQGHTTLLAGSLESGSDSLIGAGIMADGKLGTAGNLVITTSGVLAAHGQNLAAGEAALSGRTIDLGGSATDAATLTLHATDGDIHLGKAAVNVSGSVDLNASGILDNREGNVQATQLTVHAGLLDNTKGHMTAAAALDVTTEAGLDNTGGLLYAGGDARLTVSGALVNTGSIAAAGNANITAASVAGSGLLGAGIKADGSLGAAGDLSVRADGLLQAGGQTLAVGDVRLSGATVDVAGGQVGADAIAITARDGNVITSGAQVAASQTLEINADNAGAQQLVNAGGRLEAGQLQLQVANLDNTRGSIIQTGAGDTHIATGLLDNTAGRIAVNSANLALSANTLTNVDGKLEHAGNGALTITAQQLNDQRGQITGNNQVSVTAASVDHRHAATVGRDVAINAGSLDNTEGAIGASAGLVVTGGDLDNTRGQLQAGGNATFAIGNLNNTGGSVFAGGDLHTTATGVVNSGSLYAGDKQVMNVTGAIVNTGVLAAQGDLTVSAASIDSSASSLIGAGVKADGSLGNAGDLALTAAHTMAAHGQNLAAGNAVLTAGAIDLASSETGAASISLTSNAGGISTAGAVVNTAGALDISAIGGLNNRGGALQAGQLDIAAADLDNASGVILQTGAGDTTIATGHLDNTGGRIAVNSINLHLSADALGNRNGKIEHAGNGVLAVQVSGLDNIGGRITSAASLDIASTGTLDNTDGMLYAGRDAQLSVGGLLTNTGSIVAVGNTSVAAGALASTGLLGAGVQADGSLGAAGDLHITTAGVLQASGQTLAAGSATLAGSTVDLSGGQVGADRIDITARSGDVITSKALVSAGELLAITASGGAGQQLVNLGGQLEAGQLQLQVSNLNNTQGGIVQTGTGDTRIDTGVLDNTAGRIAVNSANLTLDAATLTNVNGKIEHAGTDALTIAAGQINDQRGHITGNNLVDLRADSLDHRDAATMGRQVTVMAGDIDNRHGSLAQAGTGQMTVTATGLLDNTSGAIEGNGAALVTADALRNIDGHINAAAQVALAFNHLDNTSGAVTAGGDLVLSGGDVVNARGQLQAAAGNATLTIGNLDNTAGSIFAAHHLTTTAADVSNSGSLYAGGNQELTANGAVTNTGVLAAHGNMTLVADSLDSSAASLIGAGVNADGSLGTTGDLRMTTGQALAAHGQNLAAGTMALTGGSVDLGASQTSAASIAIAATSASKGAVVTDRATVLTPGGLTITSQGDLQNREGVLQAGQLTLSAANLDNTAGTILQTGSGNTTITMGVLDNTRGRIALNSTDARLDTSQLINQAGKLEHAGSGTLAITAAQLNGGAGAIVGNGLVDIAAGVVDHTGATTSARQLHVQAGSLSNQGGTLQSATSAVVDVAHSLDNRQGMIAANGVVQITAGSLDNTAGELNAGSDLTTTVQADLLNTGLLYAGRNQTLDVGGVLTNNGSIAALANTTVTAHDMAGHGLLAAGLNANGALAASGDLTVTTVGMLQANGQNLAAGQMTLTGAALDLAGSRTSAANIGLTAISGDVSTTAAVVSATGVLAITANGQAGQSLLNQGGQLNAGQIDFRLSNLNNAGGAIIQAGAGDAAITLGSNGVLDNTMGRIAVNARNLQLTAGTIVNVDGKIEHAGTGALTMSATNLYGQRGQITGNGALDVRTAYFDHRNASTMAQQLNIDAGTLDNRSGELLQLGAGKASVMASGTLDNGDGRIEGNGGVAVQAGLLLNQSGRILAGGMLEAGSNATIDNTGGTLAGATGLAVTATDVDNTRGTLQAYAGNATLQVRDLNNNGGSIYAGSLLATHAANVGNSGTMYGGAQTLDVTGAISNSGMIAALGDTTLAAGAIDSSAGGLIAAGMRQDGQLAASGDLRITAQQGVHAAGQNLAAGTATLTGASVDLSGSLTSASQLALTASAGNITSSGATLYASGALTAATNAGQSWDNRLGQIVAGQLQVQVGSLDNRKGSIVQNGGGDAAMVMRDANGVLNNAEGRIAVNGGNLTLGAATIDNTAGVITHAGAGQLAIQAAAFNDQRGQVTSNGTLNIAAGSIDHRNASTQAGRLSIDAGSFDNRQGELVQLGTGVGVIHVTQGLDNQGGLIASNGNTTIGAQNINNQGGVVQVAGTGALDLTAGAVLDNSNGGNVAAGGNATVHAGNVLNHGGTVTAGGSLGVTADQALDNTGGLLAANGNLDVRAASVDNAGGKLASVNGNLGIIAGQLRNASGQVQAGGDVILQTGALNNSVASGYAAGGSIVGRNVAINTGGTTLDNYLGTIAATQVLDLQTGALLNQGGLLQAGSALHINTHGNTLDNSNGAAYAASHGGASGGISSGGALTLAVGNWNNAAGMLGAAGAIDGSTGYINNLGGSIVSSSGLSLTIGGLANQGGQIQAVGNLGLQAGGAAIDNSAGLIRSGATVTLGAANIINTGTQAAGLGIEGRDVSLSAGAIDNRQGGLRADNNLSISSSGQLNNASGLVSANNAVVVSDDSANRQLMIANAGGTIIGGASTALKAAGLTGVGSVMSKGDLSLDLSGNHIVEAGSQVIANRNATVTIGGNFVNDGKVQAGGTLVLGAANFDNNVTGDINAGATRVNVAGTLNNRGVIDGISTQVNAGTLNNIGTGRIYGDTLAIGAGTLNNSAEGGVAATIASRGALDIGATVINNSDHALIFSSGNMAIGGALDATGRATGAATSVTNASATIQALGDLAIRAGEVTLLNKNFKADYVGGSSQYISYYEVDGIKYDPSQVEMNPAPKVGYLSISIAGKKIYVYDYYAFTRTTSGSVVTSTDPGIISAGGDLTIDAYRVTNQNSQITAGKALAIHSQELINDFTASGTKITDVGRWDTYNYVYTDYLNGTGGSPETDEINRTEVIGGTTVAPGGTASGYQATTRTALGSAGATTGASAANVNLWLNTVGNNAGSVAGVNASQGQGAAGVGGAAGPASAGDVSGVGGASAVGAISGAGAAVAQGGNAANGAAAIGLTDAAVANAQAAIGASALTGTDRTGQVGSTGNGTTVAGANAGAATGTGGFAATSNGALSNGLPGMVAGQQGFYDTDRAGNAGQPGNAVGGGNVAHNAGSGAPTLNDPGRLASATSGGATGIDRTGNPGVATSIGAVGGVTASVGNNGGAPVVGDPERLATAAQQGNQTPLGMGEMIRAAAGVFNSAGAAQGNGETTSVTGGSAAQVAAGSGTPAVEVAAGNTAAIGTVRGGVDQAAASALSSQPRSPSIQQVALSNPSGKAEVVRTGAKPVQLPNASLFQVQPAVEARYLVETDPRFANYREWTGSDYMTSQIQLDPTVTQKRLGDGFYEQQLVREQVAELTGHRYSGDYSSDEEQYRGLMDAGVSYAQQWGLRPGVALSAEQMAALTSDIVWLVERDVTMADGSVQKALVPQVYVRLRADDIDGTGALLAGKDVDINLSGDLTNSGTIAGRDVVLLNAENVNNLAGRIDGDAVAIAARNDLNNISGAISAKSTLQASAGRDINVTTSTLIDGGSMPWQPQPVLGRVAGLYVTGGADGSGSMALSAGRDISIAGAIVSNAAATGTTALSSGRDISLAGATVSGAATDGATILSAGRDLNLTTGLAGSGVNAAGLSVSVDKVGSLVQGTKVALVAGNDINNTASNVVADQQLTASAGRDINLVTTTVSSFNQSRKGGNTITDTSTVVDKVAGLSVTGTGEGTALVVQAGRDINLTAAAIGNAGVNGQTSLVAGNNLNLKTVDIASSHDVVRNADNYTKQSTASEVGTQITGAGNVGLQAGNDIAAQAAKVDAQGTLALSAGNDISLLSGVESERTDTASKVKKSGTFSSKTTITRDTVETSNALGTSLAGESVNIVAGHDMTLAAASVVAEVGVNLLAKNDITIGSVGLESAENHIKEVKKSGSMGLSKTKINQGDAGTSTNIFGSSVTGGAVTVQAGQDIGVIGSQLTADNALMLNAGRDLLIASAAQAGTEQHTYEKKKSSFSLDFTEGLGYSKAQDNTANKDATVTRVGSELSGGSVLTISGRDTTISGSTVVADEDIGIAAGRDLNIISAQNTSGGESSSSSMKSGSIGSRFQAAIGTVKTTQDGTYDSVTEMGSQVASLGGNVTLTAGERYTQTASDVLAPVGDIGIVAKEVLITTASNLNNNTDQTTYSKTAIGGSINIPIVDAAKSFSGTLSSAGKTSDPRMQALAAVTLASKATDLASIASQGLSQTGIKISISLGNSKSESEVKQASDLAVGSTVKAGGDVSIVATGAGLASDLTISGSKVDAGGNLSLAADDQVNVLAAQNTQSQTSKSSSSGTSVGVGINLGGSQSGFSFEFSANQARGKADGIDTFYTNSYVSAGKTATLISGGDTTLKGAVTTAETIKAIIGGDLNIVSLQDSSIYASESSSSGINASLCIPPICYGVSTVGGSVSKNKANGNFVSVVEQTGLRAGDGGFQLNVAGNTDLQAGLIASSQKAIELGNNSLVTGTLTTSDLQNKDQYSASGYSVSGSAGTKASGQSEADTKQKVEAADTKAGSSGSMGFGSTSGSQASLTTAAISAGSVLISDAAQQEALTGKTATEMIAGLNRNVSSDKDTSGALAKGWDAHKMEQEVQAQVAITEAFSVAASSEISKYAAGKLAEAETLRKSADKQSDPAQRDALLSQAAQIDRDWSEGGTARMIANTAAGALGGGLIGLAGGATGSAVSGALYHADVPASMGALPQDQQARIQKMANDAGFNSLTSDADWQTLKLVSDLRFDAESQNLPRAEVNSRIGNYLTLLGATPDQVASVLNTYANAGLSAVSTPRTPRVEQTLLGPTSPPDEAFAGDYSAGTERDGVFLGTKVIDKGTQGVGNVLKQVGSAIDSSPVAKFTLEGLDFVSGPVIYGVNKIPVVEDLKNQAMGVVSGYFREGFSGAGYDQAGADDGAVGGGAIISVGLGGFAGMVKNAGKKFDFLVDLENKSSTLVPSISDSKHIIMGDEPYAGSMGVDSGAMHHPVKVSEEATLPASSAINRIELKEQLAIESGIPRNIVSNPSGIWGSSLDDLKMSFTIDGAEVFSKAPYKNSSGNSQVFTVEKSGTGIKEVQLSPPSMDSDHGGQYYKLTFIDKTKIKIIDINEYKPSFTKDGVVIYDKNTQYLSPKGNPMIFDSLNDTWIERK